MTAPHSPSPPLVDITILGRRHQARPDVSLVWVLYDEGYIESASRFCWNGTCLNCMISVTTPERQIPVRVKACEVFPSPGLTVVKMGGEFRIPRAA